VKLKMKRNLIVVRGGKPGKTSSHSSIKSESTTDGPLRATTYLRVRQCWIGTASWEICEVTNPPATGCHQPFSTCLFLRATEENEVGVEEWKMSVPRPTAIGEVVCGGVNYSAGPVGVIFGAKMKRSRVG